ncbi:peroxisomal targeting signal 1 receptor [Striga asiatica]|uniref:Peroxisomal targeting signal 1 receptor n=1 Tax=Striga asiatica TaxID=4170 RepID=A0A5A7R5Q6_STRAF|nr:peroxisomal targeting signal 1 receptor [Striga asiatica]
MAMRELVSGGAACAVPGSSSSSNPLGALANALIGSSSKTQERLREIPTATTTVSDGNVYAGVEEPFSVALPGSEMQHALHPNTQGSEFLQGFRSADQSRFSDAWDEIQRAPPGPTYFPLEKPRLPQDFDGQDVGKAEGESMVPGLMEKTGQARCRAQGHHKEYCQTSCTHFFIAIMVNALLSSLDIDNDIRARGPIPGRYPELEEYWNESQGMKPGMPGADGWVSEFMQHQVPHDDPNMWVQSFERQHGSNGWASEFEHEQSQLASIDQMRGSNTANLAAMEQTRALAHTLAQNNDPKFQNSKFLQFVSKMSRGELTIEDNQFKPATFSSPGDWATEYEQQYSGGQSWLSHGPHGWANEFAAEQKQHGEDEWVNEFSKLNVNGWSEEFERQVADGTFGDGSADNWANAYDDLLFKNMNQIIWNQRLDAILNGMSSVRIVVGAGSKIRFLEDIGHWDWRFALLFQYLNEQAALKQKSGTSRGVYVFSDMNPYVGHPNPLKEGHELFRKGLLSEAVLALEAEVLKNPDNAEGWRLLGVAHAENDDDQQAIAAMMRAQEVDPTNLEVLLALGVSHTNELEQAAALKYLYSWLRHHPKYGAIASPDQPENLYYADVARLFSDAAKLSPDDADVHIVLGVLYNLSREYDKAIDAFQTALKLKPRDYSLWNKLGATQANSVQSSDAILAYQQALDLKPNYVRAWANMGISYANQGMYEDSIRYYVRALAMNPKADNAWQYLRISLSCASRNDMLEACDSRNLDILQKEFPL